MSQRGLAAAQLHHAKKVFGMIIPNEEVLDVVLTHGLGKT
jgi:hypothetical protein